MSENARLRRLRQRRTRWWSFARHPLWRLIIIVRLLIERTRPRSRHRRSYLGLRHWQLLAFSARSWRSTLLRKTRWTIVTWRKSHICVYDESGNSVPNCAPVDGCSSESHFCRTLDDGERREEQGNFQEWIGLSTYFQNAGGTSSARVYRHEYERRHRTERDACAYIRWELCNHGFLYLNIFGLENSFHVNKNVPNLPTKCISEDLQYAVVLWLSQLDKSDVDARKSAEKVHEFLDSRKTLFGRNCRIWWMSSTEALCSVIYGSFSSELSMIADVPETWNNESKSNDAGAEVRSIRFWEAHGKWQESEWVAERASSYRL